LLEGGTEFIIYIERKSLCFDAWAVSISGFLPHIA